MFRPFYLFVGHRYTRVKRKNYFISFISLTSMMGIALGVSVLITVLSVMNGFSREIRVQMLSGTPHMTLRAYEGTLAGWQGLQDRLAGYPGISGLAPYTLGQGMVVNAGLVKGVVVQGIDPEKIDHVFPLGSHLVKGKLPELKSGSYGIVIGRELADTLNITVGDKISIIVPEALVTPMGITPRIKRFTLVGLFEIGYLYDSTHVFIHLGDANQLFRMQGSVTGIQLKVTQEMEAPKIAQALSQTLQHAYWISDWTQAFGNFFQALKMQKTVMMFILLLIIVVAGFNLVSSLVMMVTDKRTDIAILRTLGASPQSIMGIFVAQGTIIGLIGTTLGVVFGLIMASRVTEWVNYLERTFDVEFVPKDVYLVNFLPSEIHTIDVVEVAVLTLCLSLLATLYPAWRAAHIQPAEALRYE